jgi:hypothetical protein
MSLTTAYTAATRADRDDLEPGETRNAAINLAALSLSKTADGVLDPKLVLTAALSSLGTPGAFIGALVPIREAGALAPQIGYASWVQTAATRRFFWAAGSALQGLAAAVIALALLTLDGAAAGWAVTGALAVFALARALCSVTYKDALARSIPKTRRGTVTGWAASAASVFVLAFAALLATGLLPAEPRTLALAIAGAGAAWLAAALLFTRLGEREVEPDDEPALRQLTRPFSDAQFRRFVLARAMLTGTALAPPFLLLAASSAEEGALGQLGPLMIASSVASILSAAVWGRLSDRSSRKVLVASAAIAVAVLGAAGVLAIATDSLGGTLRAAAFLFVAQIAYEGVRAGRKLHLTDMATDDNRTPYTALSNTLIGAVLVLGGALGLLADAAGPGAVLILLAILAAAALPVAVGLDEVQAD